jgi:hypothetical protein
VCLFPMSIVLSWLMLWPHRSSSQAPACLLRLLRYSPGPGRDHPRAPRQFVCGQVTEAAAAPSSDGGGPSLRPSEDERTSPCPVRAWAGAAPAGRPAPRGRTPPRDQPRLPRVPSQVVGARGHQGGQCTGGAGSPGHPDKAWVARRPPVPQGRHDNHRPAPCSCYPPAPPRWCSRPCPAPGTTHRPTHALTGQQLWPVLP